ncbi:MAG: 30S ribosomal protein S20 [Anaerolineales bacterium]|nr:30S ribosomal protein S20 [Anaerolineales bacterium]MBX3005718.1 30S ribosomal protein S20 [Anaerolineales bacterium]MCW5839471.1 30S ribosomal protein S20 [Anaerolineales bacterium]
MANIKSAIKRNRQNEKRRLQNRVYRSSANTFVRKANAAIAAGDVEQAKEATKVAVVALDKAAKKSIIHANNAARRKGNLMSKLHALETGK